MADWADTVGYYEPLAQKQCCTREEKSLGSVDKQEITRLSLTVSAITSPKSKKKNLKGRLSHVVNLAQQKVCGINKTLLFFLIYVTIINYF